VQLRPSSDAWCLTATRYLLRTASPPSGPRFRSATRLASRTPSSWAATSNGCLRSRQPRRRPSCAVRSRVMSFTTSGSGRGSAESGSRSRVPSPSSGRRCACSTAQSPISASGAARKHRPDEGVFAGSIGSRSANRPRPSTMS